MEPEIAINHSASPVLCVDNGLHIATDSNGSASSTVDGDAFKYKLNRRRRRRYQAEMQNTSEDVSPRRNTAVEFHPTNLSLLNGRGTVTSAAAAVDEDECELFIAEVTHTQSK
eukprot:Lankesteria_metandrocarpae@DN9124_c0_g1_i1.p1